MIDFFANFRLFLLESLIDHLLYFEYHLVCGTHRWQQEVTNSIIHLYFPLRDSLMP